MKPFRGPATSLAVVVATTLAVRARRRNTLTRSGAAAGFVVGFLLVSTGLRGLVLVVFYQLGVREFVCAVARLVCYPDDIIGVHRTVVPFVLPHMCQIVFFVDVLISLRTVHSHFSRLPPTFLHTRLVARTTAVAAAAILLATTVLGYQISAQCQSYIGCIGGYPIHSWSTSSVRSQFGSDTVVLVSWDCVRCRTSVSFSHVQCRNTLVVCYFGSSCHIVGRYMGQRTWYGLGSRRRCKICLASTHHPTLAACPTGYQWWNHSSGFDVQFGGRDRCSGHRTGFGRFVGIGTLPIPTLPHPDFGSLVWTYWVTRRLAIGCDSPNHILGSRHEASHLETREEDEPPAHLR